MIKKIIYIILLVTLALIAQNPIYVTGGGVSTSAAIVALFTGCSGTQYLGADGACHTVSVTPDKQVSVTFDGGGIALSGTATSCMPQLVAVTIQSGTIISDVSGSIVIDVQKVARTSYTGAASAVSMTTGGTAPTLSSATQAAVNLASWASTTVAADSVWCFAMSSPVTVTKATLTLDVQ